MSLPWESAYVRSIAGGPNRVPLEAQLAAMSVDAHRMWIWGRSDPKKRGPAPQPVLAALMGAEFDGGRTRRTPAELYAALQKQAAAAT